MNKKEILEMFNTRFSCQSFDKEKVISDEDIKFILETGRLSQSSFGFEPWKFVVMQNKEMINKLKEVSWGAQTKFLEASHPVLIFVRKPIDTKYGSDYVNDLMKNVQHLPEEIIKIKGKFYKEFQEKDILLNSDEKLIDWASKQAYIAMSNMMTSASFIGVDSCAIEGFNKTVVNEIIKDLNIIDTDHFELSVMVMFGYRKEEPKRGKTRQKFEDVVTFIK